MVRIGLGSLLGNFDLDTGDPYVSFSALGGGPRTQTKALRNGGKQPQWRETYVINEFDTGSGTVIEVAVYDHNRLRHDHLVGTGQINLAVMTQAQLAGSAPVHVEIYDKRGHRVGSISVNITAPGYTSPLASTYAPSTIADRPKIVAVGTGTDPRLAAQKQELRAELEALCMAAAHAAKQRCTALKSEAVEEAVRTEARVLQERGGAGGPAPRTVVVETPGGGRTTEIVEVAASLPLSGAPITTTATAPAAEVVTDIRGPVGEVVTDIRTPGEEVVTDIKTTGSGEIVTEVIEGRNLTVEAFISAPQGQPLDKKYYTTIADRPLDEQLIERYRTKNPYMAEFETIIRDTGMERQLNNRIEALTTTETIIGTDHVIDANPLQLLEKQMPPGRILSEKPSGQGWHQAEVPQTVDTKIFAVTGDKPVTRERLTNLKEHRDFEKLYEIITRRIAEQPLPSDRPSEVLLRERILLRAPQTVRPVTEIKEEIIIKS